MEESIICDDSHLLQLFSIPYHRTYAMSDAEEYRKRHVRISIQTTGGGAVYLNGKSTCQLTDVIIEINKRSSHGDAFFIEPVEPGPLVLLTFVDITQHHCSSSLVEWEPDFATVVLRSVTITQLEECSSTIQEPSRWGSLGCEDTYVPSTAGEHEVGPCASRKAVACSELPLPVPGLRSLTWYGCSR